MTIRIIHGDCRAVLPTLADASVQCCVTSPPYYGLRDYGVAGQIGLEPTPDEYVAEMVAVFREVKRVLRDDGVLWLNIGDSYANSGGVAQPHRDSSGGIGNKDTRGTQPYHASGGGFVRPDTTSSGAKPKDLLGIPWMLAFALRADGWYLRSDVIWHKPNPMPESVRDRPTSAHEHVFLMSKSARYFYDADAVADDASGTDERPQRRRALDLARDAGLTDAHFAAVRACGVGDAGKAQFTQSGYGKNTQEQMRLAAEAKAALGGYLREFLMAPTKNARNVWTIATQPYSGAHFATMPPDLAERCIKAGTSERGACPHCGAPWERATARKATGYDGSRYGERAVAAAGGAQSGGTKASTLGSSNGKLVGRHETVGWAPVCACQDHAPVPCVVLDPFGGAGTTGLVADRLGRNAVLVELNPEYRALATDRIRGDAVLFAEVV